MDDFRCKSSQHLHTGGILYLRRGPLTLSSESLLPNRTPYWEGPPMGSLGQVCRSEVPSYIISFFFLRQRHIDLTIKILQIRPNTSPPLRHRYNSFLYLHQPQRMEAKEPYLLSGWGIPRVPTLSTEIPTRLHHELTPRTSKCFWSALPFQV